MSLASPLAGAAEPKITGSLSSATAAVGEPVDYELAVEGTFSVNDAPVPAVDGIEVRGTSHGSQVYFTPGNVIRRTSITYRLVPQREGTFTIPPLELKIDGKKLATKALTLTVTAAKEMTGAGDVAFAELRLEKKKAFIGEAVPLEVRLYLEDNGDWELRQQPVLRGAGFEVTGFKQFPHRRVELAGKEYKVITLRSIVKAGKAGPIAIGPFPVRLLFSPLIRQRGSFFATRGRAREVEITAPPVELQGELLPAAGRPSDFSGAIGKFTFTGIGNPGRVNVGEPVQMVLKVTGDGNFDRVQTPTLHDPNGWRKYDGEEQFEPTDELGLSGTKTFTVPVAPTTAKTEMPVFSFTYFDPDTESYKELKTAAAPLTVTGAEPPPAPTAAEPAPADPATPAPAAPAAATDILGILPEPGRAWRPGIAYSTPVLAGLLFAPVPLIALALLWRRRSSDHQARRRHELKRERGARLHTVNTASDPAEFYDAAAHALQIDAALASGKAPQACELADILAARKVSAETQAALEELFNARAALVYAGGGAEAIRSTDRDRVLETLAAYERSEPR